MAICSTWVSSIAPPSLLGGLEGRNSIESELKLSSELFENELNEGEPRMILFIDRFKCFDLLIPSFCVSLARDLGLPGHLATCIKGYYSGQYKCFKLGPFFGPRVVQSNGIVQGCPFNVLFANLIFSVFAKRIQKTSEISFASFLDDTQHWSRVSDFPALVNAASSLSQFDASVGQIQNDVKSAILCRKKKETQRFLIQVGRRLTKKTSVKSLGFFHTSHRRGGGKLQDARLEKAKATVLKVSKLPLSGWQKGFYIKVNAHSQWLRLKSKHHPKQH